jgi:hypothetical protein
MRRLSKNRLTPLDSLAFRIVHRSQCALLQVAQPTWLCLAVVAEKLPTLADAPAPDWSRREAPVPSWCLLPAAMSLESPLWAPLQSASTFLPLCPHPLPRFSIDSSPSSLSTSNPHLSLHHLGLFSTKVLQSSFHMRAQKSNVFF